LTHGDEEGGRAISWQVLKLTAVNSLLLLCAAVLVWRFWPAALVRLFGTGSLLIAICAAGYAIAFGARMVATNIDRAFERNGRSVMNGTLLGPALQLLAVLFVSLAAGASPYSALVAAIAVSQVAATAIGVILTLPLVRGGSQAGMSVGSILKSGLLFFLDAFISTFFIQFGVLFLQMFGTGEQLAIYGLAARLVLSTDLPVTVMLQYVAPLITRAMAVGDRDQTSLIVRSTVTLCSAYGLAVLLVFVVLGRPILSLLFGAYYQASYWPAVILLLGQTIGYICGFGGRTVEMAGRQSHALIPGIAGIATLSVAAFVLFPLLGIEGVALAFASALVAFRAIGTTLAARLLGLSTFGPSSPRATLRTLTR
jgi:O-antigen/teichoic acid export membrane protein